MMYILLAKASATGGNPRYIAGSIHGIMIYSRPAKGVDPDYDAIRAAMADEHWEDARFLKKAEVDDANFANHAKEDPNRLAYEAAKRDGLAFVVYDVADAPKPAS